MRQGLVMLTDRTPFLLKFWDFVFQKGRENNDFGCFMRYEKLSCSERKDGSVSIVEVNVFVKIECNNFS